MNRDKITTAIMLAIGDSKAAGYLTMSDERRLAAGRVYGQVILPLLRQAWDEGYATAQKESGPFNDDTETPNPYRDEAHR